MSKKDEIQEEKKDEIEEKRDGYKDYPFNGFFKGGGKFSRGYCFAICDIRKIEGESLKDTFTQGEAKVGIGVVGNDCQISIIQEDEKVNLRISLITEKKQSGENLQLSFREKEILHFRFKNQQDSDLIARYVERIHSKKLKLFHVDLSKEESMKGEDKLKKKEKKKKKGVFSISKISAPASIAPHISGVKCMEMENASEWDGRRFCQFIRKIFFQREDKIISLHDYIKKKGLIDDIEKYIDEYSLMNLRKDMKDYKNPKREKKVVKIARRFLSDELIFEKLDLYLKILFINSDFMSNQYFDILGKRVNFGKDKKLDIVLGDFEKRMIDEDRVLWNTIFLKTRFLFNLFFGCSFENYIRVHEENFLRLLSTTTSKLSKKKKEEEEIEGEGEAEAEAEATEKTEKKEPKKEEEEFDWGVDPTLLVKHLGEYNRQHRFHLEVLSFKIYQIATKANFLKQRNKLLKGNEKEMRSMKRAQADLKSVEEEIRKLKEKSKTDADAEDERNEYIKDIEKYEKQIDKNNQEINVLKEKSKLITSEFSDTSLKMKYLFNPNRIAFFQKLVEDKIDESFSSSKLGKIDLEISLVLSYLIKDKENEKIEIKNYEDWKSESGSFKLFDDEKIRFSLEIHNPEINFGYGAGHPIRISWEGNSFLSILDLDEDNKTGKKYRDFCKIEIFSPETVQLSKDEVFEVFDQICLQMVHINSKFCYSDYLDLETMKSKKSVHLGNKTYFLNHSFSVMRNLLKVLNCIAFEPYLIELFDNELKEHFVEVMKSESWRSKICYLSIPKKLRGSKELNKSATLVKNYENADEFVVFENHRDLDNFISPFYVKGKKKQSKYRKLEDLRTLHSGMFRLIKGYDTGFWVRSTMDNSNKDFMVSETCGCPISGLKKKK